MLGTRTPLQRCIRHKERNVLDHLPERDRPAIKRRLRAACDPATWRSDGPPPACSKFRKVIGYRDLAKLAITVERHLTTNVPSPTTEETATLVTA